MVTNKPMDTIDKYISSFPPEIQKRLEQIRQTIQKAAPEAKEIINYGIPTFTHNKKNLVHFAAFKSHVGFYPTPTGIKAFEKEISMYKTGKGSVQFPMEDSLPLNLITQIVEFRLKEISETSAKKKPKTVAN